MPFEQPPSIEPKKKPALKLTPQEQLNANAKQFYRSEKGMNDIDLERFARGMAEVRRRKQTREQKPPPPEPKFPQRGHLRIIK